MRYPLKPGWLIPAAFAVALYAMCPLNFAMPVIGVVDDSIIVPLALLWLLRLLPQQIKEQF